jgi:cellulose synthase/poly-beta-1,6-N-acetylglucosamine synthase-like glycosyltransferase
VSAQSAAVVVFLLSALGIPYVIFGYPLLLARLARRARTNRIKKEFHGKTVSILLPVHNGEPWLQAKLESILALDYPSHLVEILVLSDGSTDGTEAIARSFTSRARIEVVPLSRGGKAQCLNAGMSRANGEVLFFTDVRQLLDPSCLRNLVSCFADPSVGVVSGELIIHKGSSLEEVNVGLYWLYEKWIRKNLSAIDSVPGATGAVYAMRRELARPMPVNTLLDDVYLPMAAFFEGYRVILDDSALAYDSPTSLTSEFRRKVRTLAGVYQIMRAYPALLGPRNRMWIHFMSHKLARLLLPFAFLSLLVSSFWLPSPFRPLALGAQAVFYALAAADLLLPEEFALKRFTSPIRTFMVLMAASFCAVSICFLPAESLWAPPRTSRQT